MLKSYPPAVHPLRVLALSLWARIRRDRTARIEWLKCDTRGCLHFEFHNRLTQAHVGKPCPRCGESLLTQEDADAFASGRGAP